jgi:HTH-type transcriptional regulator, sugar sensing transcriptional regulator
MNLEIKDFLSSIGFGKNESEVYLALLGMGNSSVLDISKRTGIHRSNIYEALDKLVRGGLVYEISKPKRLFYARHPKSLVDFLKQKEIELDAAIKTFEEKTIIKNSSTLGISKGTLAVKQAILSLLEYNQPIYVYGIPEEAIGKIGPVINDFHKKRIKMKIPMMHIYNSNAQERINQLNKWKYTEARYFPGKYDSAVTTNICGDKVILVSWDGEISVIEIENKDIAESYRNYFDILWKKAKAN